MTDQRTQRQSLASGENGAKPPTDPLKEHLRRCDWRGFTQVANVVLYCPGLTDAEKVVYAVLASFDWPDSENQRKGYVYPGVATIAHLTRKSERQVRRILASLKQKGFIRTRCEGPLSATRWIVPIHQVNWRALYAKAQSAACPRERPDIHDTPDLSEMSPLDLSKMTPKQYEGEEYEEEQYEDPGLLRQTAIDVQGKTRQSIKASGSILVEGEGKAMPTEAEGSDTALGDGSSAYLNTRNRQDGCLCELIHSSPARTPPYLSRANPLLKLASAGFEGRLNKTRHNVRHY